MLPYVWCRYQSNYTLDIDRYLPMSYFGDLVRNISAAWEGSTALRKMYPTIRFHVRIPIDFLSLS